MELDLEGFAQDYRRSKEATATLPPPAQAAAPAQAQPAAVAQEPGMRFTPDGSGSMIGADYTIGWDGEQGDPRTRVVLSHAPTGTVVFDGSYGELVQTPIQGVWYPSAQAAFAAATALSQVEHAARSAAPVKSTVRKVAGYGLVAAALATAAVSVYKLATNGEVAPSREE